MAYDTINSLYKVTAEKYLYGEQSEYFLPYLSVSPFVTPPPTPPQRVQSLQTLFLEGVTLVIHHTPYVNRAPAVSQHIFNSCVANTKNTFLTLLYYA